AAIADGDWLVVRRQETADHGDIVAAVLDGEATVKRLTHSNGHRWLMPHNPAYTPIPGDAAAILGKVVAVLRQVRSPVEGWGAASPTDRLQNSPPGLAAPLREAIRTGTACTYQPAQPVDWNL